MAMVLVCAQQCSAMLLDGICTVTTDNRPFAYPNGTHCGHGENVLHDRVCQNGVCANRYRVQHMRWKFGQSLEYVVCNHAHTRHGVLFEPNAAELRCARNVRVEQLGEGMGVDTDAIETTLFDLKHLAPGECWTMPEGDIRFDKTSDAEHELIVCEGRVSIRNDIHNVTSGFSVGTDDDVYRFGFSWSHYAYARYY